MTPDNNFSEFLHSGFECGLIYALRYIEEEACIFQFNTDDINQLARHLEEKKPWKTATEWEEHILNHISA